MEFPGVMELDKTKPDSSSGPIYIPDGLIFGDKTVTSAYVSFFDCLDYEHADERLNLPIVYRSAKME